MTRAVIIDRPGRLAVRAVEPPTAQPGEVVVRVAWAGVCGSDVDLFDGHRPGRYARYPIVPGHEWSGVVEAVGDGVDPALLGRPAVGENIRPCTRCAPCHRGDTQACETRYEETGFTIDGAWADVLTVPAALLHPLRDGADLRAAAVIEPAACAAATVRHLDLAASSASRSAGTSPPCSESNSFESAMTFFALVRYRPMVRMYSVSFASPSFTMAAGVLATG